MSLLASYVSPAAILGCYRPGRVMISESTSLLVLVNTQTHAAGHVLYYGVLYLDLLVISAVHILSYQT